MDQRERPRFADGQYLDAEDLSALALHARVADARHALGAHTWGIAAGLDLVEHLLPSGEVQVTVAPGIAWDGYARPVLVLAPAAVGPDRFRGLFAATSPEGQLVGVWLRYDEAAAPDAGADGRCDGAPPPRVVESFAIEVGPPPDPRGGVMVAGRSIDAAKARTAFDPAAPDVFDASVPYQEFPEGGSRPPWWIPVGVVRWQQLDGQPGRLLPRDDSGAGGRARDTDLSRAARHYLGVVAETIHAADGVLRLRDRWSDPHAPDGGFEPPPGRPPPAARPPHDLVWVEGNLRVNGDTRAGPANPLRFSNAWTGFPDNALNRAEICNDTARFKTLMIVGNRSGDGAHRRVSVWDRLEVNGDLQVTGSAARPGGGAWTDSSDASLKTRIEPLTGALHSLLQLRGMRYEWKDAARSGMPGGPQLGFVAQQVEPVFPHWVSTGADGHKQLTIRGFEALAVEALRELKAAIDALEARLAERGGVPGP